MTLGKSIASGSALIRADGRIDAAHADAFERALLAAVSQSRAVAVDMSGVEHIGTAGFRALMAAQGLAKAQGKGFALAALSPRLVEVFRISRFNHMFLLYPAARDALEAVSPDHLSADAA